MTPEERQSLDTLSRQLLDFHKALLDAERVKYEAANGPIGSPGQYLNLVLEHEQFAWLRELSGLIVAIDEAIAPRSKAGPEMTQQLLDKTRKLLDGAMEDGNFQRRLAEALTKSPEAARRHGQLMAHPSFTARSSRHER